MKPRQAMLHPVLRIVAAGCVALWVGGVVLCNAEHLLEGLGSDATGDEKSALHHVSHHDSGEHAAVEESDHHSEHSERDDHDSHHHNHGQGDESCCSSIRAITPTLAPVVVVYPPAGHVVAFLSEVLELRVSALLALERRFEHPPPDRDWIFTPEVYPGPAIRSRAPPASV